jgi:uncharacterized protein YndB with AHSA1/START domain
MVPAPMTKGEARMAKYINVDATNRVPKPVGEVFQAIVDPDKLAKYFVSNANAPLAPGRQVTWTFTDVGAELAPEIEAVEPDKLIVFTWEASGQKARVRIELAPFDAGSTKIHIVESAFPMNEECVQRTLEQTEGWTDFINCMRAYLEVGVQLRKGRTKDLR